MSREKEDFRANLERLNELFPNKEMLTVSDVQKVYGYRSRNSVVTRFPFTDHRISKATLARIMCG